MTLATLCSSLFPRPDEVIIAKCRHFLLTNLGCQFNSSGVQTKTDGGNPPEQQLYNKPAYLKYVLRFDLTSPFRLQRRKFTNA